MYYYFERAVETGENQEFEIHAYKEDLKFIYSMSIVYEDNQLVVLSIAEDLFDEDKMVNFKKSAIVQDNQFVEFRNGLAEFLESMNINSDEFDLEYLKNEIKVRSNSTNRDLNFEEIICNTFNDSKDNIIDFYIETSSGEDIYGISRRIIYKNRPAVELSIIVGQNYVDNFLPINFDEIERLQSGNLNSMFAIYDAKNLEFKWPEKVYTFLRLNPSSDDKYKNILKEFIIEDDLKIINRGHKMLSPSSPEVEYDFRIVRDGEIKYVNCRLFAVYLDDGSVDKLVYLLNDSTDKFLLSKNLQHLQESLNAIQTVNKSALFYESFENNAVWTPEIYKILEIDDFDETKAVDFNLLLNYLDDKNKEIFDNELAKLTPENPEGNFDIKIKTHKGNTKYLNFYSKMVYDNFGEEISFISSCFEITQLKFAEKNNLKLIDAFNDVSNHLKSALFFRDQNSDFIFSNIFGEILGLSTDNWFEKDRKVFIENMENKEEYLELYEDFFSNKIDEIDLDINYRYNGDENQLKIIRYYLHNNKGNISGYIEDVSDIRENELNLKRINEEKSVLIKEVHHRVKNNLQIMSSLLNLEERFHRDNLEVIINSTKKRIASMALIHELAYGSENLDNVNIKDFLKTFDSDIFNAYFDEGIIFQNYSDDVYIPLNIMTPLILIFTELTFNSIKYAFKFEKGEERIISKVVKKAGDTCTIEYRDNGKGLPEDFDINNSSGLGWSIILSLVNQIDGTFEQLSSEKGVHFRISFPHKD